LLQAADVRFAYEDAVVIDGVSLAVPNGRIVGILGPNGSGKSTLLKLLAGTLQPRSGDVLFEGRSLRSLARRAVARRLAVVPQDTQLAFDYTVLEIVLMGRFPHLGALEMEGPADLEIARQAMAATGTGGFERRPFTTLSGGERQRVVIASALAQIAHAKNAHAKTEDERLKTKAVLLLDEPTAALDLGYQLEIAALLRDLNERRALTMAISTHDLAFASAVCHELVLLRAGRVLASGAPEAVLTPETIRRLYDVEADVRLDEESGRVVVVPRRHIRS
jgi:iron complex transport system ATP-binding protein